MYPHELSGYYYSAAESYFQLENYEKAIPYYKRVLEFCYEYERGDIYYRLGLCHMFLKQWFVAYDAYKMAYNNYNLNRNPDEISARFAQIKHMMQGCRNEMELILSERYSDSIKLADSYRTREIFCS